MARLCPFNCELCTGECALRIKDECAFKVIAENAMTDNIRKGALSKLINMCYGTTVSTYQDADGFGIQQTIYDEVLRKENENGTENP